MSTASLVQDFLASDVAASSSPFPAELAKLIVQHQAHLLEVVRASGEYLTSDDDKRRGRGISLLAHVVIKCPKEAVTRQEARTLTDFFLSSLSSPVSEDVLVPTLEGLGALCKQPSFGAQEAISTCRSLFKNIDLMGRPQTTRYLTYCLMDSLMAHQRNALKRMGKVFLSGYSQLVTGEKDPRNLRLAFTIAKVIILEFDISENVEDLFDITFCYFPITFTPPPNDPYGITSEQLQVALRGCLTSTPRFGPLALPLFIEKLQASTNTAKRQTLEALVTAFPVYGSAVVLPHAVTFWEAFSVEIFHATESDIEEHALRALKALLATIYPDSEDRQELPKDKSASVAWKMCDACLLELNDSDKSNATPATKILARAVSASGVLARYVVPKTFNHLLQIYKLPDEIQQRPSLFKVMAQLLEGLRDCPVSEPAEPFMQYREEVLSICTSNLKVASTRQQAIECLVQLVQLPACLNQDELVFALQSIVELLTKPNLTNAEDISSVALDGLKSVAPNFPKAVEETVLPSLFGLLPDTAPSKQDHQSIESYRLALACLAALCTIPHLFEILLIRILSRLDSVCSATSDDRIQHGQNALYAHHLITTLRIVLETKVKGKHTDISNQAGKAIARLYALFLLPSLPQMTSRTVATEPKIIEDAGRVVMLLVQQLDERSQRSLATDLKLAFFENKLAGLLGGSSRVDTTDRAFDPFSPDASAVQINLVPLYASPMYAMRTAVLDSDTNSLCNLLLNEALPRWHGLSSFEPSCKLLASLLNKKADTLISAINEVLPAFWQSRVAADAGELASRKSALRAWAWCMRGLILRSDSRAYEGVSRIVSLFSDPSMSRDAARTMAILSKEDDGVLVKENFAVIRLLYKQRFFSFILPKLVEGYHAHSSDASQATPYLVGLSCLLQSMPKQTMVNELPKLLPLLLRALELPELDLRAHVIDTLALLVKEAPETLKHQASTIVSILLRNAICADPAHDSESFVQLRLSALRCLTVFPDTIDWLSLHQQKMPVLKTLGTVVDDRKKKVRKEAVDCRARWYLFKAP